MLALIQLDNLCSFTISIPTHIQLSIHFPLDAQLLFSDLHTKTGKTDLFGYYDHQQGAQRLYNPVV